MTMSTRQANPAGRERYADALEGLMPGPPVPLRHPWRWAACAVVLLLLASFGCSVMTSPNFQWPVAGHYLFSKEIRAGVLVTIELTITAMAIGITIGIVVALMRLSENRLLSYSALAYIGFFRATPALVQLVFWYHLSSLFPMISIGVPFGPELLALNANVIITPLIAANLGLGLCEGAYMAEIVRAGILGVDPGQREAATA